MIPCEDSEFSVDSFRHTTNTESIIRPSDPITELEYRSSVTNRTMTESRNSHIVSHDDHRVSMDISDSSCLNSHDSMSISSNSRDGDDSDSSQQHKEPSPDDLFIKEFARRCAEYPGRKPILMDIEKDLKPSQKGQLPFLLVAICMKCYIESIFRKNQ